MTPSPSSYRLEPGEGVLSGVRRIAVGRTSHALEQLEVARSGDFAGGVHAARKDLKKLRSLLRLVREGLPQDVYRREIRRYRDAGRLLSGARDAEVKLRTVRSLAPRLEGELPEPVVSRLVAELERERGTGIEEGLAALDPVAREIEAGMQLIDEWPLGTGGWGLLRPGLRRSYRLGRKSMAALTRDPADDAVHDWRKRVKDLTYQLRIAQGPDPGDLREMSLETSRLSELLGDHHDLAILCDDLSERKAIADEPAREEFAEVVRTRQQETLNEALEAADRVFTDKPGDFLRRVKSHRENSIARSGSV